MLKTKIKVVGIDSVAITYAHEPPQKYAIRDPYPCNLPLFFSTRMRVPKFPFLLLTWWEGVFDVVFDSLAKGFVCVRIASPRGLVYDPNMPEKHDQRHKLLKPGRI